MKILVVDIEATGLSPTNDKIVEVGIVELCLKSGARKIVYEKVFNPGMDAEAIENSWICKCGYMTPESIINGAKFEDEKDAIQQIVSEYPNGITAYNRTFDVSFLQANGIEFVKLLPCPMLLSTQICKLPGKRGGYKWPKVEEAYKHFFPESEYAELHRGADDAMHEAEIVFELHTKGAFICEGAEA